MTVRKREKVTVRKRSDGQENNEMTVREKYDGQEEAT